MSRNFDSRTLVRSVLVLSSFGAAHALSGCGSDSTTSTGGIGAAGADAGFFTGTGGFLGAGGGLTGTAGGTAGGAGALGGGGSSGAAGAAGASTGGGAGATGTGGVPTDGPACVVTPDNLLLPTTGFKDCDVPTLLPNCMNGKCVPSALVPVASQAQLADCVDKTQKCVPSFFVAHNAKFIPPTCASLKGAEGRCLSQCIPQIAQQESFLPKDVCDTGDLCAPCYDPRTGVDTGACSQGCDVGPTKPKVVFDKCCKGAGSCVPTSAVPASASGLLGKDTCTTTGEVCAPDKLSDTTVKPKVCTSLAKAEGRCLADCIPDVAARASQLPKDVCDTNELCAPCFDPLTGLTTGACTQNGDTPTNTTPVTFPKCCTDQGHCIPLAALTTDQQTLLGLDSCAAGNKCAPDIFSMTGVKGDTCRALGGLNAEGRCVPTCVPSIQAQASRLDQGTPPTCAAGTLCAPCYDPITGADTSACSQNGDKPAEAKKVFPTCCGGIGVCVAPALVPVSQQSQLGLDTCPANSGDLCAPKSLTDPTATPPTCRAPGDIEGRCLPACLPAIQKQAASLRQQTCATGELCADCYNPLDGTDTGACTLNGDKPKEAPKLFGSCGSGRGLCVPTVLVPASLQTQVPQDTCASGVLCAPTEKAKNISYKFPTCQAVIAPFAPVPAACLPKYIIDFQAKTNFGATLLTQQTCAAGDICAPCVDPLPGGKSTGACD